MRLTKIKLSGFKSFVDPTTLTFPSNLVGVVGPNGCGKSNIIDAVTWVMGESSAKHLRGDALTDVIFNGSSTRQPVAQTTVELIFDNLEGKLEGQYANYNEISIKRQMNREGISIYFLNGTRCRRRDIQAIFLGTGLGPRSYAIIEQGVISRLIEAQPDELRTFIEEAAGISKFRERRRETENRIRHARENISRLNDIREELGKQLNHLKRQARAAERYQILKQEERQLKVELLALNWQELKKQNQLKEEKVRLQENLVEQGIAKLRHVEADIEKRRDELAEANAVLNQSQSNFYQIGGEISQLEQKIQHTKESIKSLDNDLDKTCKSESEAKTQQQNDREQLEALSKKAVLLEPRLQGSRSESNKAYDALDQGEQAMQNWQTQWDACNEATADFSRQIEVDVTRLQHLESGIDEIQERRQLLNQELADIDTNVKQDQLNDLLKQLEQHEANLQKRGNELEGKQTDARKFRNEIHDLNELLSVKRLEQQKLEGKTASLEALRQNSAANDQDLVVEWLTSVDLDQAPRLAQKLIVEPEWTLALETVLGYQLQDICVDDINNVTRTLSGLQQGQIGFIASGKPDKENKVSNKLDCLLDKISTDISLNGALDGIYVATDINNAITIREELGPNESVVTKDGIWLGSNWVRANKQNKQGEGILSREQQILSLQKQDEILLEEIKKLEAQLKLARTELDNAEHEAQSFQEKLHPELTQQAGLHSKIAELRTRVEQGEIRITQLQNELDDLETQETMDQGEYESIKQRLQRTKIDKEKLESQHLKLNELRNQHREVLENVRAQWQTTHEQSHEIALQLESISSQRASLEQAIQRSDIQISNLHSRNEELTTTLASIKGPLPELERKLETKLSEKVKAEKVLSEARNLLQTIDVAMREKEQDRTENEQQVQDLRGQLEIVRINAEETRVRLQTIQEQIQDAGHKLKEIIENLDEGSNQSEWQERLNGVERKTHRLGPINLAAIDEFNQLSERKNYLDSQNEDLAEALTTLENAIKKIDRETRTRFKETFDALNTNLKEMFPVLFGGGHAYLELTGEDLLETGVTIMAQPPGKRNNTIHLMSGGEKALTAIALVFSIFKLNPAPFCILDEVDAPLDDTNVGRFSDLLTKMAVDVQFIFVTHNKITMEIAQQLIGVTMQEAGVSRLVSVDMDEAMQMVATA